MTPAEQVEALTDAEWSAVLATLPENPETAEGWELSLVRRTVERILRERLAGMVADAKREAYDEACEHDVAVCRDGCAYNPYRAAALDPSRGEGS